MSDTNEELGNLGGDPGAADAMAWLESKTTNQSPEATKEAAKEPEQSEEVTTSEEPETETEIEAATQDTGADKVTDKVEDSVLKFLPDEIRTDFEAATDDEGRAAVIRKALMLQADYTRKTQAVAKERSELSQKAQWWDQLASDPVALGALSKTTVEDEDDFDILSADPKEIKAKIRQEAESLLNEREAEITQSEQAVLDYKAGLVQTLSDWQKINEVEDSITNAVTLRLGQRLATLGVDPMSHITTDNLAAALDDEYQRLRLETQLESGKEAATKSKSDTARAVRASSPPSQRASSVKSVDPWIAEGRNPKPGEVRAKTIRLLTEAGVDFNSLQ
jgi:hypothetical protein